MTHAKKEPASPSLIARSAVDALIRGAHRVRYDTASEQSARLAGQAARVLGRRAGLDLVWQVWSPAAGGSWCVVIERAAAPVGPAAA